MSLPLTKFDSIALTLSPLYLLLLVRLGGYIVNLCSFYSYRLIGKLTAFLQLQELSFRNRPVDCSTSATRRSPPTSNLRSLKNTHSPITLAHLSSINLVSIFRCSSPSHNPLYTRRVDPQLYLLVFHHTDTHT